MNTPAVILGNALAVATPCPTGAIPQLSTVVEAFPAGGAQGTYESALSQENSPTPGMTFKSQKFTRNGVRIVLQTTLISGTVAGSATTIPPNKHIVWSLEAYFDGYPVAVTAHSAGGSLGGSLGQAEAIIESVHPSPHG